MSQLWQSYRKIRPDVLRVIAAEFCLQLVNTAYFTIFNFYLIKYAYADEDIAQLLSNRFLVVMLLSLPIGFLIQGRRLLPLIRLAAVMVPLSSALILWSVPQQWWWTLNIAIGIQGAAFAIIQVCLIPFIMRNESREQQPEAIALHFSTWSLTGFLLGIGIYAINFFRHENLDEAYVLVFLTIISIAGLIFLAKPMNENLLTATAEGRIWQRCRSYDWLLIVNALIPSLIMGVGAGLTIPFVSLFFYHVFRMEYDGFSLMTAISTLLVTIGSVYGPRLLRHYGYHVAITLTQSLAVIALVVMAFTESFSHLAFAYGIAILCFLLRQPLMNMGNPIISEFTMNYVGDKNQEVTTAMRQSLWAGSWFFSTQIFRVLRAEGSSFTTIFLITSFIYGVSVFWYYFLIKAYQQQNKERPL
ncbi:MAG: MFS transporter [Oligoflexus sp.]